MSEDSNVRLKPFSGKDEDWTLWSNQFLAKADSKGYRDIMEGRVAAPTDEETLIVSTDSKKTRQLNKTGYSDLMGLMGKSKVAFMLVRKARTDSLPKGDLHQAWTNLKDRYEPSGIESAEEVIKAYNECVLERNQDPEEWITEKDDLQMRLQLDYGKKDYTDEDFKLSVIHGLPEEYHAEKISLKKEYKTIALRELTELLRERYKELKSEDPKKEEKALHTKEQSNPNGKKKFTGKCFHCGKNGHRKKDCHFKNDGKPDAVQPGRFGNNRGGNGPKGKCSYCGKGGHQEKDCFKKKADEENANAAKEEDSDDSEEQALTMVECIDSDDDSNSFELEPASDSDTETESDGEHPANHELFTPGMYVRFYNSDDEDEDDKIKGKQPLTMKKTRHCTGCKPHGHYRSICEQRVHLNGVENYEACSVEEHDSTVEAENNYEVKSTTPIEEKIENTLDGIQIEEIQNEYKTKSEIEENSNFHGAEMDKLHGTSEPHGTDPEKAFKIGTGKASQSDHGERDWTDISARKLQG